MPQEWVKDEKIWDKAKNALYLKRFVICPYCDKKVGRFPDFLLKHSNLIIEVDGETWHREKNIKRDNELIEKGYSILHIPSKMITKHRNKEILFKTLTYFVYEHQVTSAFYLNNNGGVERHARIYS